jgi:hypothetical protein
LCICLLSITGATKQDFLSRLQAVRNDNGEETEDDDADDADEADDADDAYEADDADDADDDKGEENVIVMIFK